MSIASVIIVNFNSGSILHECVQRVLCSTVSVEIFIADNGSTDNSIALVKSEFKNLSNLHIIEIGSNLGFSTANNIALKLTSGDYIVFINPDCLIEKNTLEQMILAASEYPNVGMAGCLILNMDGTEQSGCRRAIPTPIRSLFRVFRLQHFFPNIPFFQDFNLTGTPLPLKPICVDAISGAFMLVKRSALDIVGPLDSKYFLHCEDLDWCMRFTQAGLSILFVPHVVITHIKGSCSIQRPIFVEWHKHRGMVRFYQKFFLTNYPRPLYWLIKSAIWMRFLALVVYYSFGHIARYFGIKHG